MSEVHHEDISPNREQASGMNVGDWLFSFLLLYFLTRSLIFSYRKLCGKKVKPPQQGETHVPSEESEVRVGGNGGVQPQGNNATQPPGDVNTQPQRNDGARQHEQQARTGVEEPGRKERARDPIVVQLKCCQSHGSW